uniref:Glycosyl hydrolase family 30 beta sandwich domain-containing protein n=1 Tax=Timema monikensis TaxID=170555 RepID=A0A7R9HUJ6_9NEOP|nr:unnamed protein product [Timema monikensis]
MFVPTDSQHVSLTSENDGGLLNVTFLTPGNDVIVVLLNSQNVSVSVLISDPDRGHISVGVQARSINTIIYTPSLEDLRASRRVFPPTSGETHYPRNTLLGQLEVQLARLLRDHEDPQEERERQWDMDHQGDEDQEHLEIGRGDGGQVGLAAAASKCQDALPLLHQSGQTYATNIALTGRNYITSIALTGRNYINNIALTGRNYITSIPLTGQNYITNITLTGRNYITSIALTTQAYITKAFDLISKVSVIEISVIGDTPYLQILDPRMKLQQILELRS